MWPSLGIDLSDQPIEPEAVFARSAPLVLEIGFGMGETTVAMAAADRTRDVLAVDVHTPGAGALVRELATQGLTNVRVIVGDAMEVLRDMIATGALAEVRVFFPDPWPKLRHHKRRLINGDFAALVADRLRPGGLLHVATDWAPYAEHARAVLAGQPLLHNPFGDRAGGCAPRPASRPVTRFERQGLAKGHRVYDLIVYRALDGPVS